MRGLGGGGSRKMAILSHGHLCGTPVPSHVKLLESSELKFLRNLIFGMAASCQSSPEMLNIFHIIEW